MKSANHILKTKGGRVRSGRCQFPLCCNFFSLQHNTRKYCRCHKRIPDTRKASVVSKIIEERDGWIITTSVSIKKGKQNANI